MNSGISITTGGTTISAVLTAEQDVAAEEAHAARSRTRASAAQPVLITHDADGEDRRCS